MKSIGLRVSEKLYFSIKEKSVDEKINISEMVRKILEQHLESENEKDDKLEQICLKLRNIELMQLQNEIRLSKMEKAFKVLAKKDIILSNDMKNVFDTN